MQYDSRERKIRILSSVVLTGKRTELSVYPVSDVFAVSLIQSYPLLSLIFLFHFIRGRKTLLERSQSVGHR